MFLAPIFLGVRAPKKLCAKSHTCLAARHVEKFTEVTPTGPKLTGPYSPNIVPIFFIVTIFWGHPSPMGCALPSLSHTVAHAEFQGAPPPIRAKICSPKKIRFGLVNMHV